MAIAHGQRITLADLQAFAARCNAASSTYFNLADFFNVSPMYQVAGNNYGYDQLNDIQIENPGSGYTVGQQIALDTNNLFDVVAVDDSGGLVGIRPTSLYAYDPNGTLPTSPASVGTGTLAFTLTQVGPTAYYGFPDFIHTDGKVTKFNLVDGGSGYAVNDTIGFSELTGAVITVDTVDGSGKILTFTKTADSTATTVPQTVRALPAVAITGTGVGAVFEGVFTLGMRPKWLTELKRLRAALATLDIGDVNTGLGPVPFCVSGPHPQTSPTDNFKETWYYFADTGTAASETVQVTSDYLYQTRGYFQTKEVRKSFTYTNGGDGWWPAPNTPQFTRFTEYEAGTTNIVSQTWTNALYPAYGDADSADPGWTYGQFIPGVGTVVGKHTETLLIPAAGLYPYDQEFLYVYYSILSIPTADTTTHVGVLASHVELPIVIGGNSPLQLTGYFEVRGAISRGETIQRDHYIDKDGNTISDVTTNTADSTDPASLVTISGNFPGALSVSITGTAPNEVLVIRYDVDEAIAPGRYAIILDINNHDDSETYNENRSTTWIDYDYEDILGPFPNSIRSIPIRDVTHEDYTTTTRTRVQFINFDYPAVESYILLQGEATTSVSYDGAEQYPGIHNDKDIYRIRVPGDDYGLGGGLYSSLRYTLASPDWLSDPYPQPEFQPEILLPNNLTLTPSAQSLNPSGVGYTNFWTCYTPPIERVRDGSLTDYDKAPWDLKRTYTDSLGNYFWRNPSISGRWADGVMGNYNHDLEVASQSELPLRVSSQHVEVGYCIIDPAGNLQRCSQAGVTNATPPPWYGFARTVGTETEDGTAKWICYKVLAPWPTIEPDTTYAAGAVGYDTNGNEQTCTTGGLTGPAYPTWATDYLGETTFGASIWKMTNPAKTIKPAVHRFNYGVSTGTLYANRHPVYWEDETIARLKPPTTSSETEKTIWGTGSQWQNHAVPDADDDPGWQESNLAFGRWIYSVSFNRIRFPNLRMQNVAAGSTEVAAGSQDVAAGGMLGDEIEVTIGCIRDGSFVAFGTYTTGQTIRVLWPIFTSDALVYQCAERVDVQAVSVHPPIWNVSPPSTELDFPISTWNFDDCDQLLKLISTV